MTEKVFFSVTMSLDGFIAPDDVPVAYVFSLQGQNDPRAQRWMTKWLEPRAWLFPQRWIRENLKLGDGGEEGLDNDTAPATYERTGASIMGKRMFDGGELAWPEEAPFHTPVFVVTHTRRDLSERPGGTTIHFVNDGIDGALLQAREAAGDRDVRIAPGDPPDLHRRETLDRVPAACGAGVSPRGEVPVGQVSSSVRSAIRIRRPQCPGRRRRFRPG